MLGPWSKTPAIILLVASWGAIGHAAPALSPAPPSQVPELQAQGLKDCLEPDRAVGAAHTPVDIHPATTGEANSGLVRFRPVANFTEGNVGAGQTAVKRAKDAYDTVLNAHKGASGASTNLGTAEQAMKDAKKELDATANVAALAIELLEVEGRLSDAESELMRARDKDRSR